MAWTQDDIDKLDKAISKGTLTVAYRDRTLTYRSLDEMLRIRTLIKAEVASSNSSATAERVQRVSFDKGYQ